VGTWIRLDALVGAFVDVADVCVLQFVEVSKAGKGKEAGFLSFS
jgi:hypothetical protein